MYRELAIETFQPQFIVDLDDTARMIAVCEELTEEAGQPLTENNEDEWMEFVYMATEIAEISQKGFTYRKERNPTKPSGWEHVLYTRQNHPGFKDYQ